MQAGQEVNGRSSGAAVLLTISLLQTSPDVPPGSWSVDIKKPGSQRRAGVIYFTVTLMLLHQKPSGDNQDGATAIPQRVWEQAAAFPTIV